MCAANAVSTRGNRVQLIPPYSRKAGSNQFILSTGQVRYPALLHRRPHVQGKATTSATPQHRKEKPTHPVSPVASVVAIRFAIEVVHLHYALQSSRISARRVVCRALIGDVGSDGVVLRLRRIANPAWRGSGAAIGRRRRWEAGVPGLWGLYDCRFHALHYSARARSSSCNTSGC